MFFLILMHAWAAEPLRLEDAITKTLAQAPEAQAIAARRVQAEANVGIARSAVLPQLMLSGNYQHWDTGIEIPNFLDPTGDPIVVQAQDALAGQASLSQVVFTAAGIGRVAGVVNGRDLALAQAEGAEADLRLRAAGAWVALRSAQVYLQATQEALVAAEGHLKVVLAQVAAGTATPLTQDRANLAVAEAQRRVLDAQKMTGDAQGQIRLLVGEPVQELAELPVMVQVIPEADLVALALAHRPEVLAAQAALAVAQSAEWTVVGDWAPTVTANAVGRVSNSPGFSGNPGTWYVGASVSLPVLDGGLRFADAKKVHAQLEEAQANLARVEAQATEDVHSALRSLDLARQSVAVAKQAEVTAIHAYGLADSAFNAGTATLLDVEDANNAALDAKVNRIRAEGQWVMANLQLERVTSQVLLHQND